MYGMGWSVSISLSKICLGIIILRDELGLCIQIMYMCDAEKDEIYMNLKQSKRLC